MTKSGDNAGIYRTLTVPTSSANSIARKVSLNVSPKETRILNGPGLFWKLGKVNPVF